MTNLHPPITWKGAFGHLHNKVVIEHDVEEGLSRGTEGAAGDAGQAILLHVHVPQGKLVIEESCRIVLSFLEMHPDIRNANAFGQTYTLTHENVFLQCQIIVLFRYVVFNISVVIVTIL